MSAALYFQISTSKKAMIATYYDTTLNEAHIYLTNDINITTAVV